MRFDWLFIYWAKIGAQFGPFLHLTSSIEREFFEGDAFTGFGKLQIFSFMVSTCSRYYYSIVLLIQGMPGKFKEFYLS